jgi:hypothetical protein
LRHGRDLCRLAVRGTNGRLGNVNELVTPLERAEQQRAVRTTARVLVLERLGPLTVLGGIVWAIAQPYRIAFFYPDGKGFFDWIVQPPLLVVLVGVLFAVLVAPGLVDDLETAGRDDDAPAG